MLGYRYILTFYTITVYVSYKVSNTVNNKVSFLLLYADISSEHVHMHAHIILALFSRQLGTNGIQHLRIALLRFQR